MGMPTCCFSSSSVDNKSRSFPNPNPENYRLLRHRPLKKCLIVEIQYLDCTNYEGRKILVFENIILYDLLKQKLIDPHFSESKKFISPIARFEPTTRGWVLACNFCKNIENN